MKHFSVISIASSTSDCTFATRTWMYILYMYVAFLEDFWRYM